MKNEYQVIRPRNSLPIIHQTKLPSDNSDVVVSAKNINNTESLSCLIANPEETLRPEETAKHDESISTTVPFLSPTETIIDDDGMSDILSCLRVSPLEQLNIMIIRS